MKAKHLLAALVLPAVFSACSQDELVTNSVDKEVVGTPIGYLEFTASRSGATTRLAPGIGWEEDDKIGMGWISDASKGFNATANLYSNHPIYYRGEKGSFKSETMILKGLYIASFPFQETKEIAPLEFNLDKQKSEDSYYSKRWNVSGKFINLTLENAGLGKATALTLVPLTNLMKLNIKLPTSSSVPADLKITGVTLDDGGNGKLVNKLTLKSDNSAVADGNSALAAACWTGATGNIEVQVGEDEVGAAIDATKGLDVYVQMGAFDAADATTLTIHTNYGDASITTGTGSVSWSSKALNQEEPAKVNDFKLAVQAMNAVATSKEYGQNVAVNVTLDPASIEVPTKVTNQEDLDKIIATLESLGQLDGQATIEFAKSDLKKADGVVDADGDVILTDLSGLNKIGGAITFQKNANAPTNVYISGELALQAVPAVTSVDFTVLNGNTLTVSEDLDLGTNGIIVNAGATLVNKAKITANTVTTTAGVAATDDAPAIPAGLYISEVGADASGIASFTNGGAIEWKAGKLHSSMNNGVLYANVTTIQELSGADKAFDGVTANCEIIIANDFTVAPQWLKAEFANIKKMTIKGNVTFGLGLEKAYEFSALTNIDVQSGSFNLTGGDQGTDENAFYVFKAAAAGCRVSLAFGTELNIPAGAKLDLGTSGIVSYTNAIVTNNGFVAGQSLTGTGTWNGNAIGVNPKSQD